MRLLGDDETVGIGAAGQQVLAARGGEGVEAVTAENGVFAATGAEGVVAFVADDAVIARAADHGGRIVAGLDVAAGRAEGQFLARRPAGQCDEARAVQDDLVGIAEGADVQVDRGVAVADGQGAGAGLLGHRFRHGDGMRPGGVGEVDDLDRVQRAEVAVTQHAVGAEDAQGVDPVAAIDRVHAGIELVDGAEPVDQVVAGAALDIVGAAG